MKVFGVLGAQDGGAPGLMERLAVEIAGRGITVSTVKWTGPGFDIDQTGRDSQRHRAAGATEVMVSSDVRWALMHELREAPAPELPELLARLAPVDLVLVEGFADATHPKIAVRSGHDGRAQAVPVEAGQERGDLTMTCFDPDDVTALAGFVLAEVGL